MPVYENTAAWINRGEFWMDNRVLRVEDSEHKDYTGFCPIMRFDQEASKYQNQVHGALIGNESHVDGKFDLNDLPHLFIYRPKECNRLL